MWPNRQRNGFRHASLRLSCGTDGRRSDDEDRTPAIRQRQLRRHLPRGWAATEAANGGSVPAYGEDAWTKRASDAFRDLFDKPDAEVFFAFNGTAANSLALASLCQSYHSVICSASAHVETDECGAPEFFSNGSETAGGGERRRQAYARPHPRARLRPLGHPFPKPRVVTITQPTETGQVVFARRDPGDPPLPAVSLVCAFIWTAHASPMPAPASAASRREMTWRAGVDLLCFGGTKNGMAAGEAILFFDPTLAEDFGYRCQAGGSARLEDALPHRPLGRNAGRRRLAPQRGPCQCLRATPRRFGGGMPGFTAMFPVEANAVFLKASPSGWRLCGRGGGVSTRLSAEAPGSCSPGIPIRIASTPWFGTSAA